MDLRKRGNVNYRDKQRIKKTKIKINNYKNNQYFEHGDIENTDRLNKSIEQDNIDDTCDYVIDLVTNEFYN